MIEITKELFAEKLKYTSEFGINFDNNSIKVFGEVTEDIGAALSLKYDLLTAWANHVEKKKIEEITLIISSFGGSIYSIYSALDFYHELLLTGVKVNTVAQGLCMSAATVLLSGGTGTRAAYPNCKFLLHDVQIEGIGGTATQVQHTAKTISNEQMEMFAFYALFANRDKQFSEKELKTEAKKWLKTYAKDSIDISLSAKQMLDLKLIDTVF